MTTVLRAPAQVVELDLDRPGGPWRPGFTAPVRPQGPVVALVRRAGRPLGLVAVDADRPGPDGSAGPDAGPDAGRLRRRLVEAAERHLDTGPAAPAPPPPGARAPLVSVIVCTRGRPTLLGDSLSALLRTDYPATEFLVVDNAPEDDATERLIRALGPDRLRYLREPVPGLARARNRGLSAARGEYVAFTDDDALADPGWVSALAGAFRADPRVSCVTGLVVPAELDTEAQAVFERYCGFGKGFASRDWSTRTAGRDPLFPFAAGRFGTGANMAFRTTVIRDLGGFDPATGAGTPTRGGEDLLAFLRVLVAGHTLAYRPDAVVWHRHRRTMAELEAQIQGFGTGLGAYLTAAVSQRPGLLAELLRRLPAGTRYALRRAVAPAPAGPGRGGRDGDPGLARLGRLELRGLLRGPFSYLVSRRQDRRFRAEDWS
ncbi:glycosyltransferase family 2 protein [Kitasatospora sp. NBC_01246]|uniref:glycosyltransferase family 2 protein n=1 Tax=Kitasatospora sp. NBC_01246 TaxID=2903570 RepID=UPI002E34C597|nr:glycosyltransferase family A protein [Kitasatospora sp. NBC_01246]